MFDEKLIALRKEKQISQEQLADILCTSRQAVSKWERGEAYPDITKLKDLAIYFNVSIDYLLDCDLSVSSINGFIERLDLSIENKSFDVSIEEIKTIVTKNINNFELLANVVNYLMNYWLIDRSEDVLYLVVDYLKRIDILYPENKNKNVDIDDAYKIMISCYYILGRYDLASEFLESHKLNNVEIYNAYIQVGLENYEKASEVISNAYVQSIINILNLNVIQARLAIIKNQIEEAYEITKWGIDFIKSVVIKEDSFLEIIFFLTFYKASIEKYLELDYEDSLKFLNDNYSKIEAMDKTIGIIKFNDNKVITSFSAFRNIKDRLNKDIEEAKKSLLYNSMVDIYKNI